METEFSTHEMLQGWADYRGYASTMFAADLDVDGANAVVKGHLYADETGTPVAFDVSLNIGYWEVRQLLPEFDDLAHSIIDEAMLKDVPGLKRSRVAQDVADYFGRSWMDLNKAVLSQILYTPLEKLTTTLVMFDLTDQPNIQNEFAEDPQGAMRTLYEMVWGLYKEAVVNYFETKKEAIIAAAIAHQEKLNAKKANKAKMKSGVKDSTFTVWNSHRNGYLDCDRAPMKGVTNIDSITPENVSWVPCIAKNDVYSCLKNAGYSCWINPNKEYNKWGEPIVYVPVIKVQVDNIPDSGRHTMIYKSDGGIWVLLDVAKKETGANMSFDKDSRAREFRQDDPDSPSTSDI